MDSDFIEPYLGAPLDQDVKEIKDELLVHGIKMEAVDFDEGESVVDEKPIINPIKEDTENKCIYNAIKEEINKTIEEDDECKFSVKREAIDNDEHQNFINSGDLIIKHEEDNLDESGDVDFDEPYYHNIKESDDIDIDNPDDDDINESDDVDIDEPDYVDVCSDCTVIVAVNDNPVLMGTVDRAAQTIPKGTLVLRSSDVKRVGIYSCRHLKKGVRMGPYEGHTTKVESTLGYTWKISGGKLLDASDETCSNYLRYINYAKDISEQNLMAVQYKGDLYYQTCRDIEKGEELLIYFDGKQNETYYKPIDENFDEEFYTCQFCQLGMKYESHRDKHQMFCKIRTDRSCDGSLCIHFPVSSDPKHAGEGSQIELVESTKTYEGNLSKYQSKHDQKNVFKCSACDFETCYKDCLNRHIQTHSLINVFKCIYCNYETNTSSKLYRHKMKHDQKKVLKCTECDYETYFKYSLKIHRQKHNPSDMFICAICDFKTCYKDSLNKHIKTHNQINMFKCIYCSYETNTSQNLRKHKVKHNQNKVLKCTDCDYETYLKSRLKDHQQKHNPTDVFKCADCDFETCYKSNLSIHQLRKHKMNHDQNKVWKCTDCDYGTHFKSRLKMHQQKHNPTDVFKCSYCNFESCYKRSLYTHKLHMHKMKGDQKNAL